MLLYYYSMWRCGATGLLNDVDTGDDDLSRSGVGGDCCAICCDRSGVGKTAQTEGRSMDPVIIAAALIILAVEISIRLL